MEESEKRRDRLKAMRMEAAQTEVSRSVEMFAMPGCLSNPLLETSASTPVQEELYRTPRFDYYTDPMSAFSANKKKSNSDNQMTSSSSTPLSNRGPPMGHHSSCLPGPRTPNMTPSPSHQLQNNYSFDQRMHQADGHYTSAIPHRSPRGIASPFHIHQGTPPQFGYEFGGTASNYGSAPYLSPRGVAHPFPTHQRTPEAWYQSGGTATSGFPSNSSRGDNLPFPGFGPIGSSSPNYGPNRAPWHGNSPSPGFARGGSTSPGSGRGKGHWFGANASPGLGRSGGRGLGFRSHGMSRDGIRGPECFFDGSILEDPWQHMEPVIWKRLDASASRFNTQGSSNSWLPKSISAKKARVSESLNKSRSQPGLAEYLAASFREAVSDVPDVQS